MEQRLSEDEREERTQLERLFTEDERTQLRSISRAPGFVADVGLLRGYIRHLMKDFKAQPSSAEVDDELAGLRQRAEELHRKLGALSLKTLQRLETSRAWLTAPKRLRLDSSLPAAVRRWLHMLSLAALEAEPSAPRKAGRPKDSGAHIAAHAVGQIAELFKHYGIAPKKRDAEFVLRLVLGASPRQKVARYLRAHPAFSNK